MFGKKWKNRINVICPNCGRILKGATKEMIGDVGVCPKCKNEFVIEEQDKEKFKSSQNKPKNYSVWDWRLDETELKNQVDNYTTLKITKSYRGISVLIISSLLGISLLLSFFGIFAGPLTILWGMVIYSPLIFFVYRGHRWSIILLMILYTLDKGYLFWELNKDYLFRTGNLWPIFWWIIVMPYFWKALRVENERRKKVPLIKDSLESKFCHKCGGQLKSGSNFCSKCGEKVL